LQVSEPDQEDDDLLVIDLDEDDDDEKLYKPFRHTSNMSSNGSVHSKQSVSSVHNKSKSKSKAKDKSAHVETKPIDLLAVLLGGPTDDNTSDNQRTCDISNLIEEATIKSRKARSMTTALATKQGNQHTTDKQSSNDLYVETATSHTEAALSFQKVYRSLLGIDENNTTLQNSFSGMSPSEELAKSMVILAHGHVRMAASLRDMGVKWNMGKAESFGIVRSNTNQAASNDLEKANTSDNQKKHIAQHERIRLAVRGALDTTNHEADITNSTFLARSTFLNATTKPATKPNNILGSNNGRGQPLKENPVDDL
jgi:hypothetical protein